MRILLFLLLSVVGLHQLRAEEETEPSKPPPRQMRLLTVGEMPPFRQEIRDGVRYQLPAPPGSLPPVALDVRIPSKDGEEKESGSFRPRLGSISAPVEVPGGGGAIVLRLPETAPESEAWCQVQRPESGDFIVVMWRDRRTNTWDKPTAYVMPTNLPAGKVSLINVAPGDVAVGYELERIALPPLRPLIRPLKPGKPLRLQVGLPSGNALKRLVTRSIEQLPGQHSIVVFFRNDGEKPRSPLGIKVIRLAGEEE